MLNQRDKELLLRDLSRRLSCGVRCQIAIPLSRSQYIVYGTLIGIERDICKFDGVSIGAFSSVSVDIVKPYLRSMYTMTDEEAKEYLGMLNDIDKSGLMNHNFITKVVDWLDKKMFDHRGLIPMSLALEAPENMYKNIKS